MQCDKTTNLIKKLEHALAESKNQDNSHSRMSTYRDAANLKIELRQHINGCKHCRSLSRMALSSKQAAQMAINLTAVVD